MAVLENEEVKLLWDFSIQKEIRIDDVACPFDTRIEKKEKEKFEHYMLEYTKNRAIV